VPSARIGGVPATAVSSQASSGGDLKLLSPFPLWVRSAARTGKDENMPFNWKPFEPTV